MSDEKRKNYDELYEEVLHLTAEVERWKQFTALAMEHAGITTIQFSHEQLCQMRWNVRLDRDLAWSKDIVTIEHQADASSTAPKYLFVFEGCSITARTRDSVFKRLERWVRSNFQDAVGVVEMPVGSKLKVMAMETSGGIEEVDPDKIGLEVVYDDGVKEESADVRRERQAGHDPVLIERAAVFENSVQALDGGPAKRVSIEVQALTKLHVVDPTEPPLRLTVFVGQDEDEILEAFESVGLFLETKEDAEGKPLPPPLARIIYDKQTKMLLAISEANREENEDER